MSSTLSLNEQDYEPTEKETKKNYIIPFFDIPSLLQNEIGAQLFRTISICFLETGAYAKWLK